MGRVRSLDRIVLNTRCVEQLRKGCVMKPSTDKDGYKCVRLSKDGKHKNYRVHRLVAQAFIPNPNDYPLINHKDENRSNNEVYNLEWCSHSHNINYGTRNEKISKLLKGKFINYPSLSRPILQFTKDGDFVAEYPSLMEASRQTGIHHQSICACCTNRPHHKSAGGYKWKHK